MFLAFNPVSSINNIKIIAPAIKRNVQNKKGVPRLILEKLLPKGGAAKGPVRWIVYSSPTAIPEYFLPTPSNSRHIVAARAK